MNLDFARRLRIGFSLAVNVNQLAPCYTFSESRGIDLKYEDYPRSEGFTNPWHIGTLNSESYPDPHALLQAELELLVFMFGMVVELKPKMVVETGTNVGLMTRALAAGCWTNGFGMVVSADTDQRMVDYAKKVCEGLPAQIRCCPAMELPELRDADIVFIDSSYESRSQEIGVVKSGAVYVYHDTFAEGELMRPQLRKEKFITHFDGPRGFSIVRKP